MKQSIPLIVGNWKLHPKSQAEATALAQAVATKHKKNPQPYVAIAPTFVHLSTVAQKLKTSSVALAAQDVSLEALGPFTGDVSAAQLADVGVSFVIIGHSERRAQGETDSAVVKKVQQVLKRRMIPIVCIGEKERDEQGQFFSVIEAQLRALVEGLTIAQLKKVVIAYEPIWAIGTGNTATVDDVKEMQLYIETVLTKLTDRKVARSIRLLYGGSVKPHNAAALHADGGMRGFLVGGASLKASDFMAIVSAVSE